MSEDQSHPAHPKEDHESSLDEYAAPALTDLGSFEELTEFNPPGVPPDGEGFS